MDIRAKLIERLTRYVKIDTTSKEGVEKYPSTDCQLAFQKILKPELEEIGLSNVKIDNYGYLTGEIPANCEKENLPVIGFLAHVDTSPETPGKNVNPIIHANYDGNDIILPKGNGLNLTVDNSPILKELVGKTIITSDGSTLLGADDKAGIAMIVTLAEYLISNPEIKHGTMKIAFTLDEEVSRGVEFFDVKAFGCDFAYTLDGHAVAEICDETFNASLAKFTVEGINTHPGQAKGKMMNSIRVVNEIINKIPYEISPEMTDDRTGYLHPYEIEGGVETTKLKVLVRDHDYSKLKEKEEILNSIYAEVKEMFPKTKIVLDIKEQYRNMKEYLDKTPLVYELAYEAFDKVGVKAKKRLSRGGLDGSDLTLMGLPCPDISCGGANGHMRDEFCCVEWMETNFLALVELLKLWTRQ
ncbi:MAG: peptidase T [Pseudomonadota bacterium]